MYGGQSTYIPFKVNPSNVIPLIFASSLLTLPLQLISMIGHGENPPQWIATLTNRLAPDGILYNVLLVILIVFFAYFYTSITFNPMEVADNMKKQGGFIPGIRPGKPTQEYLEKLLNYIIFIGAAGLTIVAVIPFFFNGVFGANVSFGGTSIIIVVGVVLETLKQIESRMLVRNYKGFLSE